MRFWYAVCCFLLLAAAICAPMSGQAAVSEPADIVQQDDLADSSEPQQSSAPEDDLASEAVPEDESDPASVPEDDLASVPEDDLASASEDDLALAPEDDLASEPEPEPLFFEKPFADYTTTEGLLLFILVLLLGSLAFKLIGGILHG